MALYILTGTCLLVGLAHGAINGPVAVTGGILTGVPGRNADVSVFKGIAFAAPPTGDRRWKPPAMPNAWTGTKTADKFSADCIRAGKQAMEGNEDCLYLNVWTAAKSPAEGRPVLVYLPDAEGASHLDGEVLAREGVVVVTANSRTGLMGFLAHPDLTAESDQKSSGNYGLLDQIAALGWVQHNIAAFGGDPKRVTAAGPTLAWLSGSPLAKGMFARAIAIGGGEAIRLAEAEKSGDAFAQAENAHSMRFLRPMEAGDLVQATLEEHYNPGPVVDGWVLTAEWKKAQAPLRTTIESFDFTHPSAALLDFINGR